MKNAKWLLPLLAILTLTVFLAGSCGDDDDDSSDDDDDADVNIYADLVWQNGDDCCHTFAEAKDYCDNLVWSDHDDWRLPTIGELRSLITGCAGTETGGACGVTDTCTAWGECWTTACDGCQSETGPGPDGRFWPEGLTGQGYWYWSATEVEDTGDMAWPVCFYDGYIGRYSVDKKIYVRCVR